VVGPGTNTSELTASYVRPKVALVGSANMAQCGGSKRTFCLVVVISKMRYSQVQEYAP
jgi:hypothetical protein